MTGIPRGEFGLLPGVVARVVRHRFGDPFHSAEDESGNGLIETAVVLPVFLTIFMGICQFAIVLMTYCNATYACRLASRDASMHSNSSLAPDSVAQVQSLVTSRLFISPAITPTITVNYYTQTLQPGSNIVGDLVGVSVSWSQTMNMAFIGSKSFSIGTQNYKLITR